jgi:alpha-N-acetylglucosamine transferase
MNVYLMPLFPRNTTMQARFEFVLNKLHVWNLLEYERVIYLDADNIALRNMDELFLCGHFCALYMNVVSICASLWYFLVRISKL